MEGLGLGLEMRKSSKAKLRVVFLHLENEVPGGVARQVRNLRHPDARWVRLPVGVLFVLGGLLAPVVPILGVWMIPLGLLLLAYDVPFLPQANRELYGLEHPEMGCSEGMVQSP
jgi:hypothetical protein